VIRDLGDGLVVRRATAADADALVEFNADYLRFQGLARTVAAHGRDRRHDRHELRRDVRAGR